jgi:hypothetical protein
VEEREVKQFQCKEAIQVVEGTTTTVNFDVAVIRLEDLDYTWQSAEI